MGHTSRLDQIPVAAPGRQATGLHPGGFVNLNWHDSSSVAIPRAWVTPEFTQHGCILHARLQAGMRASEQRALGWPLHACSGAGCKPSKPSKCRCKLKDGNYHRDSLPQHSQGHKRLGSIQRLAEMLEVSGGMQAGGATAKRSESAIAHLHHEGRQAGRHSTGSWQAVSIAVGRHGCSRRHHQLPTAFAGQVPEGWPAGTRLAA